MKKIGYDSTDEAIDGSPEERLSAEELLKIEIETLKPFIEANYSPGGMTGEKEFRTSMELLYELKEMVEPSNRILNATLADMGFEIRFIENVPNWVMYERKNP